MEMNRLSEGGAIALKYRTVPPSSVYSRIVPCRNLLIHEPLRGGADAWLQLPSL